MKAITFDTVGGPDVLHLGEAPDLHPGPGEVLVKVHATALNRADLLQRRGLYPPPAGASDILGLEMAGEVIALGDGVTRLRVGDRIAALLPGGGYASQAVIPEGMAIPLPASLSYVQGAAIPEAFLTAYLNLFDVGGLTTTSTTSDTVLSSAPLVLVHAGASGVGTSAIQLIREATARCVVTAGSEEKIGRCIALGAEAGWNYHSGSFVPFVHQHSNGEGANLILDFIGASYFADNLASLAVDGRLIVIGTMGGSRLDTFDLGTLLAKRQQVIGTALRSQTVERKIRLTRDFWRFAEDAFAAGRIAPVIDSVFHWSDAASAHQYMEENRNVGKIVLEVVK